MNKLDCNNNDEYSKVYRFFQGIKRKLTTFQCSECSRVLPNSQKDGLYSFAGEEICETCGDKFMEQSVQQRDFKQHEKQKDAVRKVIYELFQDPEFIDQLQWRLALNQHDSKADSNS